MNAQAPPVSPDDRVSRPAIIAALVVSALGLMVVGVLLEGRLLPLGVPGQWTWLQFTPEQQAPWLVFLPALGLAAVLAGWVAWGFSWVERAGRARWIAALVVTAGLAGAFQVQVEAWSPTGLFKWATTLYFSHVSPGYTDARDEVRDAGTFLRKHSQFLAQRSTDNVTTQPPGWFVLYRLLLDGFQQHPASARAIVSLQPADMVAALDEEAARRGSPIESADRATIATVALGSRLAAFLGVLPIAWLVRQRTNRRAAWLAAAVAGLVPAGLLFAPRSDTVYPAVAALILAVSCFAVRRRSCLAAAAAGLLLFGGMFFSLAFLGVVALALLFVGLTTLHERAAWQGEGKRLLVVAGAALAGFLVGPLLLWLAWRHNIFAAWLTNLAKSSQFIEHNRRYWPWIVVNLAELAVAMGLPASMLLVARFCGEGRALVRRQHVDPLAASWIVVLLLLNFSGNTPGEVARLWIFLMPLGAALAAEALAALDQPRPALAASFVALQGVACLVLARGLNVLYHAAVAS